MTSSIALRPPTDLHGVPLDPEAEVRRDRVEAVLWDAVPPEDLGHVMSVVTGIADDLLDQGVRLLGVFGPRPATIAVATRRLQRPIPLDDASVGSAITGLLETTSLENPDAECRAFVLPAGRTVVTIAAGRYDIPVEEIGNPGRFSIPTRQIRFLIPTPEWDGIVVLDVSTTDEAAWPDISREAVRIARSLRFLDDGESAREGEHLLRL